MSTLIVSETEINTQKAPCAWFAVQDRKDHDRKNRVCWTNEQVASMDKLLNIFSRVFGEENVVMNTNKNFFTFKVFKPSRAKSHALNMLKVMIEEFSSRRYNFKFNPRNEVLYHVYPK